MRTYNRWECPCCRNVMSGNGLVKASHQRAHVRAGLMTEHHIMPGTGQRDYFIFSLTDKGGAFSREAWATKKTDREGLEIETAYQAEESVKTCVESE